ncbi:MAG: hypothetical protein JSR45_12885 [Proteobacteria bacterium]|nr:hypothetical protein [Pseudomonadota bacterium]
MEFDRRTWVALVTFERTDHPQTTLPDEYLGACGWMGCIADDAEDVPDVISRGLAADGLRLVQIQQIEEVGATEEVGEYDTHLAENMAAIEPGKRTVWGTLHVYVADGEA